MNKLIKAFSFLLITSAFAFTATAQGNVPQGWHLKDFNKDSLYGISLNRAYDFLASKNRKSTTVIVGVVDSGIDTTHEDLKPVLWVNEKEISGNGIDDDKNGYVDDIHGWNFLGSKDGKENVTKDSYEAARVYWKYKDAFDGKAESEIAATEKENYKSWLRAKEDIEPKGEDKMQQEFIKKIAATFFSGDSTIKLDLKKDEYSCKDLANYTPSTPNAETVKGIMMNACKGSDNDEITNKMIAGQIEGDLAKANNATQAPKNYRADVVKDNYDDFNDKFYGNNNLTVDNESALHGTHVSGIIAAKRDNNLGMDGVADNVRILTVRAVPDGDEHDKDIALAIRYAVDNGARVINMSFGKGFSPEKKWVDEAVKYAEEKNVLLIHAAGNDNANIDTAFNYPSALHLDGKRPANWMTIGASGDKKAGGLVASFSNYGDKEVDVFAPGVLIYATVPGGNTYRNLQGTSMASPVVAGLAALIMSYYPDLTAVQVKNIIEKSVSKPATDNPFAPISVNDGVVNAYNAVVMADAESKGTKAIGKKVKKVKSSSKKKK